MTDSDVDVMVLGPDPTGRLQSLVSFTSDVINVPNWPEAKMKHFTFQDVEGEIVWIQDESSFRRRVAERDRDPLSNLTPAEADGVCFMKRLRMEAFRGVCPKSRMLTHVVKEVHRAATSPYDLCAYIPKYLAKFLDLAPSNFVYYHRYTDAQWAVMKDIIRRVAARWRIPFSSDLDSTRAHSFY